MPDLGAIEEDVPFDEGTATALITACRSAASAVDAQAGQRSSWVTTATTDFKGHFSELFKANAQTAAGDATELANRLREVATAAERLKEEAHKEQERRQKAREWKKEHDDRNLLEQGWDWATGGDDPPVGPPADPISVAVSPAVNRSRETPAPGGGSSGGGGTSSARPSNLRTFATGSKGANDTLRPRPAALRTAYQNFQARCRWGTLSASGVFTGFDAWLSANDNDVTWATTVADAFKAAGGEGEVSTLSNSAVQAALQAANVTVTRQDLVIDAVQAQGHPPTSGYANDPVNTATGNFVETETDVVFPGAASMLQLSRTYNSFRAGDLDRADATTGAYGPGWSSVCEAGLALDDERARLVLPDGRQIFFPRLHEGWDRAVGESLWLERTEAGDLVVTGNDGTWSRFSAGGALRAYGTGPVEAKAYVEVVRDDGGRVRRLAHARGQWVELDHATLDGDGQRVVAARTADGREVTYAYDAQGRLVSATSGAGTRTYRWDDDGFVAAVVDADGVVEVENTYDAQGRVTRQRSPFGRTTRFVYLPGRVTVVSDEDGSRSNTWIHDERGRLVGVVDADERRQSTSYDRWGNPVLLTERDGATTVHEHDARGRRVRTVTPAGADLTYGYDELDRVTTVVTEQGAVTGYTYEGELREPATIRDPEGGVTRLAWADGLLVEVVDPTGVVVRLDHDEHGDLVATSNATGATARLERDALGRVTAAVTPSGHRTTFAYDPATGLLAERVDADGAVRRWERSAAGRLVAEVDPMGARTTLERGAHGEEVGSVDPLGRRVDRRLDDLGNLAGLTLPDGSCWEFTHDALSRLVATTDPTGAVWREELDAAGHAVAVVDPTGVRVGVDVDQAAGEVEVTDGGGASATRFDPLGRLTSLGQPDGSAAIYTYDRCGRPVEGLDAAGGLSLIRRDAAGRPVETVSPTGAVTRYEHDGCGRVVAVVDPLGGTTRIAYDVDSRPVAQTLPTGEVVETTYDPTGRVLSHEEPGLGTLRWTYDRCGRVVESVDPRAGRRRFRYDDAGQLVESEDGLGHVTRYDYDLRGRAVAVTSPSGAVTRREFDALDRCVAETDPLGRTTRAGYDAAGRLAWQESPSGRRTTWTYDAAGRPVSMAVDGRTVTALRRDLRRRTVRVDDDSSGSRVQHELEWDARGQLVRRSRDGREVRWTYDADGRRTSMTAPDGSTTAYGHDAAGRLRSLDHSVLGRAAFDRDASGRLVTVQAGGLIQSWEYRDTFVVAHTLTDEHGARRTEIDRDADGRVRRLAWAGPDEQSGVTYGYDAACQLLEARTSVTRGSTTTASTRRWRYDADGRLTRESVDDPEGGSELTHVHDVAGQLLATTAADGARTTYIYDAEGRRTSTRDEHGARELVWNPTGYLAGVVERRGGEVRRTSVHADALGELASVDGTELFWDTAAFAGAPVLVGDTPVLTATALTGVGERWTAPGWRTARSAGADPWAAAGSEPAGGSPVRLGRSGEVHVDGLEWMGARVYDSATRGFLSVDPLDPVPGTAWSANPYAYAGNDPLHALDPAGLRPVTDAELQEYRDSNGIGGTFDTVTSAVGGWLKDNWEYVAGGAVVIGGAVLVATGVGGPVGAMLISAGADTIIQKATTGEVNWGEVGVSFAAGAFGGGAVAARLGATGVRGAVVAGMASGAVGGGATGAYQYATSPGPHTVSGFVGSTARGTATGLAFGGLGGAAGHGVVSAAGRTLDDVHPAPAASPAPAPVRLPQDVRVNPQAPPALPLNRPVGGSATQNAFVQQRIGQLQAQGASDFRVNQQQVDINGVRVGVNRPDLQYTQNGGRVYEEFDVPSSDRGPGHEARILANDPGSTVNLFTVP